MTPEPTGSDTQPPNPGATSIPKAMKDPALYRWIRRQYLRFVMPHFSDPLIRQRFKLLYFVWGYSGLLRIASIPWRERLRLLRRFLVIDWSVLHAHAPAEISEIACILAERPARAGEVIVEAGCWQGGSSTKFSILCSLLGYDLHIYDSFEGVETLSPEAQANEWEFAGQYASPEGRLRENLARFGEPSRCSIHPGWFSETLAREAPSQPVRVAYIDCDLAKGTFEALQGVTRALVADGVVFSQDYHIDPVRRLLWDPTTWQRLGIPAPEISVHGTFLASLRFRRQ
jgi:hypothetical protein